MVLLSKHSETNVKLMIMKLFPKCMLKLSYSYKTDFPKQFSNEIIF